jgi:hypothetical protein
MYFRQVWEHQLSLYLEQVHYFFIVTYFFGLVLRMLWNEIKPFLFYSDEV